MRVRQFTIVGVGLIGGSLAMALRRQGFSGRIIGCDRAAVLDRALVRGIIDEGLPHPAEAVRGSQIVVLATPILAILDLIHRLGPALPPQTLLTDLGSTKSQVMQQARTVFGKSVGSHFLGCHPMAGKEQSGLDFADPDLFQGAPWFVTPVRGQRIYAGLSGEFLDWVDRLGARIASLDAEEHDRLCAWTSHLPQMLSTALAATLVDEYGEGAPLLELSGRALKDMTRIASSPYAVWRDIAITNKVHLQHALLKLEQRLTHIRENLDTRELAMEFERARDLRKTELKPQRTKKA